MALILAICSPQPNWIPPKPKLMLKICQKERRGFVTDFVMVLTVVDTRELLQSCLMFGSKLTFGKTPLPVAPRPSRYVHPRLRSQAENVLNRNQRCVGDRNIQSADEHPIDFQVRIG